MTSSERLSNALKISWHLICRNNFVHNVLETLWNVRTVLQPVKQWSVKRHFTRSLPQNLERLLMLVFLALTQKYKFIRSYRLQWATSSSTTLTSLASIQIRLSEIFQNVMQCINNPSASWWLLVFSQYIGWYVIKFPATTNSKPLRDKWSLNEPISSSNRDRLVFLWASSWLFDWRKIFVEKVMLQCCRFDFEYFSFRVTDFRGISWYVTKVMMAVQ